MSSRWDSLRLVAACWLHDLQAEDWHRLQAVPELVAALPDPSQRVVSELAAEHVRLFVVNVPPYERLFLGGSGEPPESRPQTLSDLYASFDWVPPPDALPVGADHAGVQLLALSAAMASGRPEVERRLVADHLALWLPLLAWATRRLLPAPFYSAVVELTLDMVLSRLDRVPSAPAPGASRGDVPAPDDVSGPEGPGAGDPGARLGALLWPSACGCYISRAELLRIAQWLCVPAPAGGRADVLVGLLRSAADRDVLVPLLDALENLLDDARLDYQGLAADWPAWQPYAEAWGHRLDAGVRVVADLRAGA